MHNVVHSYKYKKDRGNLLPLLALCIMFTGCREDTAIEKPKVVEKAPIVELSEAPSPTTTSVSASETAPVAVTQPAAALPAIEGIPTFQPLLDARVGEWASYAALDSRALRYDIAEIDGSTVRTRVIVYDQGKPLGQPATREDAREADLLAKQAATHKADRKAKRVQIELMGRTWNAILFEDRWTDEEIHYIRRTWVSADAPVFGILRMEMYGDEILEARMELSGFGESSENRQ